MGKQFKVKILDKCRVCGDPRDREKNKRLRSYCSKTCRKKETAKRYKNADKETKKKRANYQRKLDDDKANVYSPDKIKCLVCGRYYTQVGSHAVLRHGFETAREYREHFGLVVKRGTVPKWYRKQKGDQAIENGTAKNLKKGKRYRFNKGQKGVGVYQRSNQTLRRLKQGNFIKKEL